MIRTSQVIVENWPLARVGAAATLIWLGLRFLEAGSKVAPHHPGCCFVRGRLEQIKDPILCSFGDIGRFLSKR